ncbi:hypothetical protein [Saccharococcus caldoxylosilyticus]|uniref:hypothetical protein n=1 Tax=Saccharococcus caldoxylosilyticus TaxID=81408 RepID=UPI0020D0BCB4|nr:hypothetical protein [Parageobacillus caldoxylosilyticus]
MAAFPEKIGIHAADILHQRMTGEISEPKRLILQPELVVRQSSSSHFHDLF